MLDSAINYKGKIATEEQVRSALRHMTGVFTNLEIASALGRAGYEPNDLWARQEVANRLLQKARKAGLVDFDNKVWRVRQPKD
jgi:hypothetical protein